MRVVYKPRSVHMCLVSCKAGFEGIMTLNVKLNFKTLNVKLNDKFYDK